MTHLKRISHFDRLMVTTNDLPSVKTNVEKIEITPMSEADLPEVLGIERASFPDPWSERMFRDDLKDDGRRLAIVLKAAGRVAGYAIGWFVDDEFHLGNIAITPGHKGQGLGRKLLRHCIDQARAHQCVLATLEVRASNEAAISLYRSFGFKEVALRKKYYQTEDALVMLANLKDQKTRGLEDKNSCSERNFTP